MVSIVAFQAVDRGSIPCWRSIFSPQATKNIQIKKLSEVGFEPTPTYVDQNTLCFCRRLVLSLAP